MALNLKKIPNAGDRVIDEATGITIVYVAGGAAVEIAADIAAANGIFTVVGQGRTPMAAGAMAIPLHPSTPCKYFYFWLDDGASTVHYKATGADAAGITDLPQFASMGPRLIKLVTPATSITLYGAGTANNVNWIAGN